MPSAEFCAALVKAQSEIKWVEKNSKHFQGYKYAAAEDMIAEARRALTAAGLSLVAEWKFHPSGDLNGTGVIGTLEVFYDLYHSSGEGRRFTTDTPVIADRGRPADKSQATALTYNLGYFLRNLLMIPRGDGEDAVDARVDGEQKPQNTTPVTTISLDKVKSIFAECLMKTKSMKTEDERTEVRNLIQTLPKGAERDSAVKSYQARVEFLKTDSNGKATAST